MQILNTNNKNITEFETCSWAPKCSRLEWLSLRSTKAFENCLNKWLKRHLLRGPLVVLVARQNSSLRASSFIVNRPNVLADTLIQLVLGTQLLTNPKSNTELEFLPERKHVVDQFSSQAKFFLKPSNPNASDTRMGD